MDPGRYSLQQGWDNNSVIVAPEGYGAINDRNYRAGSYDDSRFVDERYSRDNVYPRNAFQQDVLESDNYPPPPATGVWPQSRRRTYEEEYPADRESRRHEKPYMDSYREIDNLRDCEIGPYHEVDQFRDMYCDVDNYHSHENDRATRFGGRKHDDYAFNGSDYRSRISHKNWEDSRERDYDYDRYSYDLEYERGTRRDDNWKRRGSRDRERDKRGSSRERSFSPRRRHERSHSRGHYDRARSRSPGGRSHGRSQREDSFDDGRHEKIEKRRDREEKRSLANFSVAPSATVVVKGLLQKTTEEDLYQMLAEWAPLRHVRVIKERNSGISRGFAFIDFPSVGAACAMMDRIGDDGLVVDGRKLFFEYSSKPTGGAGGQFGQETAMKSGHSNHRSMTVACDWMCTICGCVNFARRTSCFQCNEARSDDAPSADIAISNSTPSGRKGFDAGPTHVLVVRGLDENADEEMLHYEFSKHAPIKDLRLVRDKFTHVSRGFAFVHFHSIEDATKALDETNGTTLEKNGQILRVAYAKSIFSPGSGSSGPPQSSSLAAAAIEAAAFAQQYDAIGWAPKEYNPDVKQSTSGQEQAAGVEVTAKEGGSAPQSGFVWDEASGYYYDAASGFYYDGNTGLYYDGNNGIWYSFDHQTQQYLPCTNPNDDTMSSKQSEHHSKPSNSSNNSKAVISAPPATITTAEKAPSLHDAVHAAAAVALAAEKKEKEKSKEIKLASKSSILANKKKMNNVLTMWKQRSHEGQAPRLALYDNHPSASADDRPLSVGQTPKMKLKSDILTPKESMVSSSGVGIKASNAEISSLESPVKPRAVVSNSSGGTLMGVIRGSGGGCVKSKSEISQSSFRVSMSSATPTATASTGTANVDFSAVVTPYKTDVSALASSTQPVASASGKRRFSEMPMSFASSTKEQNAYRDRAAERRSLYGSSSSGGDLPDIGFGDSNRDSAFKKGLDSMPFPPGVGGGWVVGDTANAQSYEAITADKAIDENNVGNRMLHSMGWHDGLGLGKDGSGMTEPLQARARENRAGLGSQKQKLDPSLEVNAGDSYKTLIHKKALARFREMSETS